LCPLEKFSCSVPFSFVSMSKFRIRTAFRLKWSLLHVKNDISAFLPYFLSHEWTVALNKKRDPQYSSFIFKICQCRGHIFTLLEPRVFVSRENLQLFRKSCLFCPSTSGSGSAVCFYINNTVLRIRDFYSGSEFFLSRIRIYCIAYQHQKILVF
jgi:hypothetical protein